MIMISLSLSLSLSLLEPTGPPLNTTIVHVTKSYVIVSWQPPDAANQNGEIIMYTICYAKKDISNVSASSHLKMKGLVKRSSVTQSINTTLNTVNITDLIPDTTYVVSISAWTSVGQGPPTPPVVFQTDIATNKGQTFYTFTEFCEFTLSI